MKALILAGGLGTRLSAISEGKPKPLMDIAGRPFLSYILDRLIFQGIQECILAVSYQWEMIYHHFGDAYENLKLLYSIEKKPLGTGGAVLQAATTFQFSSEILILNGDTFFDIDLHAFQKFHSSKKNDLSLALCYQQDASRYGKVILNDENKIISFSEKEAGASGWINGGIYLMHKRLLSLIPENTPFSLEKELFPNLLHTHQVMGFQSNAYFIDIGIPEDYAKAVDSRLRVNHNGKNPL